MPAITPSLWFDHNLEEAVAFYTSVFPNSRIEDLNRSTDARPGEPGSILSGTFWLDGNRSSGSTAGRTSRSARRCLSPSTARTRTRSTTTGTG
jgi:predicted 3-demethylubiquinone-9 3-methyltransferase (glyoxalase superfamily)